MYDEAVELKRIEELLATLEGAVVGIVLIGVTRSTERDEKEVLCGFVRGGRGLVDKEYVVDLMKDRGVV